MKRLYLFDFDGTLTNKDTLFDFLKFSFPDEYSKVFLRFTLSFILVKLKLKSAAKTKKDFIAAFLKGKSKKEIESLAQKYFEVRAKELLRPKAVEFIQNLDKTADKYLVSASLDLWLIPFAEHLNLKLICTKAEFINEIFTGNFSSPNCNYIEKKQRILNEINLSEYGSVHAFGDSKGDKEMFSLASEINYKIFD